MGNALFYGLAVTELLVLVLVGAIVVLLVSGGRPADLATFLGYLVIVPLTMPAATFWALVERTRWGSAVIVLAGVVLPVLVLRLHQVWG